MLYSDNGNWCVSFYFIEALIIKGMMAKPKDNCDYIIVLGCQIRGDHITRSLKNRLDVAVSYAIDNPDTTIIVSGGRGKGENTTEAFAMYNYLVSKGIDGSRIIQEDKSTDTSENMKYSVQYIENKDSLVGIATNNFHIARSRLLARHAGLNNTCGMPAESDHVLFINYMVREAIGIVKDFVFGNF